MSTNNIEKCANCGNNLKFNPSTQSLFCEHCTTSKSFAQTQYVDNKIPLNLETGVQAKTTIPYNCPNCGANDSFNETSVSYFCAHCGTPIVLDTFSSDIDALVPFKISVDVATDCFRKWIKKRFWAPRSLKKFAELDKFEGHYLPVWAFDANTATAFSGVELIPHTVHKMGPNGKSITMTEYEHRPFSGNRTDDFSNVLVTGNTFIPNSTLESLEPFDYTTLKIFSNDFLLGFFVDTYSILIRDAYTTAQNEMKTAIRNRIIATKTHIVENLQTKVTYSNPKQARFLVPIWTAIYKFKNKGYKFFINGCTGEVHGAYPKSILKISIAVILGLAIVAGIVILSLSSK